MLTRSWKGKANNVKKHEKCLYSENIKKTNVKKRQRHARVFFLFLFFNMFSNTHTRFRYKEYAEKLRPLVKDTVLYLHKALESGNSVLVEGANAAMLDIDFGACL